jgi:hypothetical protein
MLSQQVDNKTGQLSIVLEMRSPCIHKKVPPPKKQPSFREEVRMIASLGGFLYLDFPHT